MIYPIHLNVIYLLLYSQAAVPNLGYDYNNHENNYNSNNRTGVKHYNSYIH